jgi:hypothetical protein
MANNLKNIIKNGVNVLLEINVSDLPQKQVVSDKSAHDAGVISATSDNIIQKFRELGIDAPIDELATIEMLKSKGVFGMSFKLNKSTKFFDGKVEVSGKAKVDGKSGDGKLKLYFTSNQGHKVAIIFDPEGLKSSRPETGQPMTMIQENVSYNVKLYGSKNTNSNEESIKQGEVSITLEDGSSLVVKSQQLSKLSKMTSKSGKDYLVSPNPSKQGGVKEGFVNVTIVKGSQYGKSFAIPKDKLKTDKSTNIYFPENGKPQIVKKGEDNSMVQSKLMIVSLPDIGKKDKQKEDGSNLRFTLDKPITVDGELDVEDKSKLGALNIGALTNINKKLKGVKATLSASQRKDQVIKLILRDGSVVMLKPEHLDPNPEFLGNWNNLSVEIGKFASGVETWEDVLGRVTLKLSK